MMSEYEATLKPALARVSLEFELQQAAANVGRARQLAKGNNIEADIERLYEFVRDTIDLIQRKPNVTR